MGSNYFLQLAILGLCISTLGVFAEQQCMADSAALSANEVQGTTLNEETGKYEITHEGVKWVLYDEPLQGRAFFHNVETEETYWTDPRSPPIEENTATNFEMPTVEIPLLESPKKQALTLTLLVTTIFPILLFAGFMIGRIYYLHTNYPELLWPTRERKNRYKNNNKSKLQKARGKMSQDGKGGRSANS